MTTTKRMFDFANDRTTGYVRLVGRNQVRMTVVLPNGRRLTALRTLSRTNRTATGTLHRA